LRAFSGAQLGLNFSRKLRAGKSHQAASASDKDGRWTRAIVDARSLQDSTSSEPAIEAGIPLMPLLVF